MPSYTTASDGRRPPDERRDGASEGGAVRGGAGIGGGASRSRSDLEMAVSPQPNEWPVGVKMKQRRNSMWLEVSVPVLSEKMCETWPSSSISDI